MNDEEECETKRKAARRAALWAFIAFFFLMVGYYILRPLRESFGVERGPLILGFLYIGTFSGTLIALPIYSWLVSRLPRQKFIPLAFRFLSINLLAFALVLKLDLGGLWPGRIFYCWLSVYSVFTVSIVWSYLVDLFNDQQTKEMFGPIAVGMSAGAIAGSLVTELGVSHLGIPALIALPILIAEIVLFALRKTERHAAASRKNWNETDARSPIGGGILEGVRIVRQSPYLLLLCLLLFCTAAFSTVFYFAQNRLIGAIFVDDITGRTELFARLNFATQLVTITLQAFFVTHVVKRFGTKTALCVLPIVGLIGLIALGLNVGLAVFIPCQVLILGTKRGMSAPTKQMMFSVVDRRQKYKSKNFIDTVIVRGSDVLIVWLLIWFETQLSWGVGRIVLVTIPLTLIWIATGYILGRKHDQLAEAQ